MKNDNQTMLSNSLLIMAFGLIMAACWAFFTAPLLSVLPIWFWALIIIALVLKLALLFTSWKWTQIQGLNIVLFTVFTILSGLTLAPILASILGSAQWLQAWIYAFGSASLIFILMWIAGHTMKADLTKYSRIAFIALIWLIIAVVVNLFLQSGILMLAVSGFSIILFSFFTAYDIQKIKNGHFANAFEAGINLYIDFINLFVSLYNIIMSFTGSND